MALTKIEVSSISDDAISTAKIADDAITLAKLAAGTDGELITWDAAGNPAAVAVGTSTQVLTSNGSGAAPTFSSNIDVPGSVTSGTIFLAATDTDTSNTGSITIDFSAHQNFVLTLTGSITLANPSTEAVGQCGVFVFIQDGTGSRTLSLGTDYETAAGGGITLSTAAGSVDIVPYFVKASGSIQLGAPQLAFS